MNTMKRAHEIRKQAAKKWNCKTSEIIFSICLEMAWAEKKESKVKTYVNQYGNRMIETVINGTSYDIEIFEDDTEEDIRENFFFEFGTTEESKRAFEMLIAKI
jgi:hypothetical protein